MDVSVYFALLVKDWVIHPRTVTCAMFAIDTTRGGEIRVEGSRVGQKAVKMKGKNRVENVPGVDARHGSSARTSDC